MRITALRKIALIGLVLGLGLATRAAIERSMPEYDIETYGPDPEAKPENPRVLDAIRAAGRRIAPLSEVKTPPRPGEWLDRHKEPGQTFEQYRTAAINQPSQRLSTLAVQPWGDMSADPMRVVSQTAAILERFYGTPVRILKPISLDMIPESARRRRADWDAERIATAFFFDALYARRPKDTWAILAITTADLSPGEGGRWVFGHAASEGRVAVCSLFRHGDPAQDFTTCLRRSAKTALHETGHLLGIAHCAAYECCMNGASNRAEADSRPLWFCHECEQKVWLACGVDPATRYARLAEFAEAQGLSDEARFWRTALAALESRRAR
jgi:archaemetzincin